MVPRQYHGYQDGYKQPRRHRPGSDSIAMFGLGYSVFGKKCKRLFRMKNRLGLRGKPHENIWVEPIHYGSDGDH